MQGRKDSTLVEVVEIVGRPKHDGPVNGDSGRASYGVSEREVHGQIRETTGYHHWTRGKHS